VIEKMAGRVEHGRSRIRTAVAVKLRGCIVSQTKNWDTVDAVQSCCQARLDSGADRRAHRTNEDMGLEYVVPQRGRSTVRTYGAGLSSVRWCDWQDLKSGHLARRFRITI